MDNDYDIANEDGLDFPLGDDEVDSCIDAVLAHEGVGRPCMVSVSVVSDERIRQVLPFLFAPGLPAFLPALALHLLGHDHLVEEEAVAMEALEDKILSAMPTDGTLGHVVITRHRTEVD